MTQQDTGFYARTPRIVRTEYKNLTITEKWFYTCLKDLCGDKGTCFRTLRTLAQETDISISTLSHAIHHLHEAGLIHAEKKLRGLGGKEVWHITIVDIWQANALYCTVIPKMNENGEPCFSSEQPTHTVPVKNNVVFSANNDAKSCFSSERSCLDFTHRRRNNEEDSLEEYNKEEGGDYEEEKDTPFSCRHSLSETQEQEQVTTRSITLQRVGTSLQEQPTESGDVVDTDRSGSEGPQKTPSWIKTFQKPVSKKPAATYKKKLIPPPLEEARPLTKNEQRSLNEQERNAIWQEVEAAYGQPFDEEDRKAPKNVRGMAILRKKNVDALMIHDTIDAMDDFEIRSFNLTLLAERITTLEALRKRKAQQGKKEQPGKKTLSQAEIDALPPPSEECLVPWGVYTDLGLYWWQDQYRTLEEADALGYNGGFGYYHQQKAPPSWREEEEVCNVN